MIFLKTQTSSCGSLLRSEAGETLEGNNLLDIISCGSDLAERQFGSLNTVRPGDPQEVISHFTGRSMTPRPDANWLENRTSAPFRAQNTSQAHRDAFFYGEIHKMAKDSCVKQQPGGV